MRFRSLAPAFAVGALLALAGTTPTYAFGGHGGGGGGFHGGGGGLHGGGFHGASGGGGFHGGGFRGAGVTPGLQAGRSFSGQSHVRSFGGAPSGTYHVGANRPGGFRNGYGRGFGYGAGGLAFGYGLGYGGYGDYDPGYADYSYADPAYPNGQPGVVYAPGPQYSQDQGYDVETVQTGRSAATVGQSCATPVKVCTLYNQSYVGGPCSCKVPGGRAHGRVSP